MKNKHLEIIINEVTDCEKLAETHKEFTLLHSIYLDAQHLYKRQKGHYYPRREREERNYNFEEE